MNGMPEDTCPARLSYVMVTMAVAQETGLTKLFDCTRQERYQNLVHQECRLFSTVMLFAQKYNPRHFFYFFRSFVQNKTSLLRVLEKADVSKISKNKNAG